MDRIRKALDLARLEREQGIEAVQPERISPRRPGAAAAGLNPVAAGHAPLAEIIYSRTPMHRAGAEVLERHRILAPTSADPAALAFRMLRTQVLQRMDANGWRTLAIFSPGASDGKTTAAVNLAASLAFDRLHTVLLVELDFKQPTLAQRLGLSLQAGSDDAWAGAADIESCLHTVEGFGRLVVMPARSSLQNSSEVLAGPRSREIVAELRGRYPERIVIFDLPPVLRADDALSFAPLIECGLLISAQGQTRRDELVRTVELLRKTPLLGTVLNRATDSPAGY